MLMRFRPVAGAKKLVEREAAFRVCPARPPELERCPLRQPIGPTHDQNAAQEALTKKHSPHKLEWKNKRSIEQRGCPRLHRNYWRNLGNDWGGRDHAISITLS